ncbi:MAG: Molybdopterin-guanine dinucleotide biosynthesis adapter protein [Syntrophomonadaceae bacterium]|nr:Molybdopterin-guanine dinucleotide biosynthesis adapter protein [Bacillota bacterium]
MSIPVISVVGHSDSGKTTLICGLLPELKRRGYRVATIKHDVHGAEIDRPGKDTWKHSQAGADIIVLSSPGKIFLVEKVDEELTFEQVIARIEKVDLILSEGYKKSSKPKIEVFRSTVRDAPLCGREDNLLALVSDLNPDLGVPVFALDDYPAVADLIEQRFLLKNPCETS